MASTLTLAEQQRQQARFFGLTELQKLEARMRAEFGEPHELTESEWNHNRPQFSQAEWFKITCDDGFYVKRAVPQESQNGLASDAFESEAQDLMQNYVLKGA